MALDADTQERMRRVRVLLAHRFDYLPQLRVYRPKGAVDGPAESRYVPCEHCEETGVAVINIGGIKTTAPCGVCNGTARRRKRKTDVAWDEYVEAPLEIARAPRRNLTGTLDLRADIARIDRELRKLRRDELAREGKTARDDEEQWIVAFDRQERTGSFRELRFALAALGVQCPKLRWALKVCYESVVRVEAPNLDVLEPLAVLWLARRMRGQIKLPPEFEEEYAAEKRMTIEDCLALGWKVSRIARELGVTEKKVKAVAKGKTR